MRAIFHLNADLDVVVQVEPGNSVVLGIREGIGYGDSRGLDQQPSMVPVSHEPQDRRVVEALQALSKQHKVQELKLSKSEARAIASALMACAAEL